MEFLQGMVMTKIRFSSQLLLNEDILWTTSTIVLKQVSVNDKGYSFFEKNLVQSEQNLKQQEARA